MSSGYRLGRWVIRPQHAQIERGDEVVHVKPKTMAVLECLLRADGEVVTRDQLFESVWPGGVVSDATLTQCIVELRRAFGESAQNPQVIKTIPKIGFCLIPPIEDLAAERQSPEDQDEPKKPGLSNRLGILVAAVGIAALAIAAWWYQQTAGSPTQASRIHETGELSIAVLPFIDMSEEPGSEYFADGLSEELQNLLARISQLKVAARTSSFSFRDKDLTIADIASTLNVAHVLEGSVRKSGDRIRITVQLVEAASGFELWSESYDRTLDDIFAVQDDVATAVVDALRVELMGEPPRLRETDTEVYSRYLQALFLFNQVTAEGRAKAVRKLQDVLAIDPNYAPAVQLLAAIYLYQSNAGERPFEAGFELSRKTALEALTIDPDLAQTWGTLAYIESFYDWDWQAAGRKIERMLELEPENAVCKHSAATYYTMLGRFEYALELLDQAIQLDPLSAVILRGKVFTLLTLGRLDEAEGSVQELRELFPNDYYAHWLYAKTLLLRGDAEHALKVLENLTSLDEQGTGLLAMVLYEVGRVPESEAVLDSIPLGHRGEASYYRALYYAWTGDLDRAFEHLEEAVEKRYSVLSYVLGEPVLYPLHDDLRWPTLLEQMGLLTYWLEVPAKYGGPANPAVGNSDVQTGP